MSTQTKPKSLAIPVKTDKKALTELQGIIDLIAESRRRDSTKPVVVMPHLHFKNEDKARFFEMILVAGIREICKEEPYLVVFRGPDLKPGEHQWAVFVGAPVEEVRQLVARMRGEEVDEDPK